MIPLVIYLHVISVLTKDTHRVIDDVQLTLNKGLSYLNLHLRHTAAPKIN